MSAVPDRSPQLDLDVSITWTADDEPHRPQHEFRCGRVRERALSRPLRQSVRDQERSLRPPTPAPSTACSPRPTDSPSRVTGSRRSSLTEANRPGDAALEQRLVGLCPSGFATLPLADSGRGARRGRAGGAAGSSGAHEAGRSHCRRPAAWPGAAWLRPRPGPDPAGAGGRPLARGIDRALDAYDAAPTNPARGHLRGTCPSTRIPASTAGGRRGWAGPAARCGPPTRPACSSSPRPRRRDRHRRPGRRGTRRAAGPVRQQVHAAAAAGGREHELAPGRGIPRA